MFYHLFSSPSLQNRIPFVLNPKFLIALLISIQSYALLSQSSGVRFNRININQGLSLSSVYCIHQDSKGFLWFGTEDGLNKFDGSNFTIFRYVQGDTNSITYKWIEIIFEDHLGNLWFGSRKGLTRFEPVKEIFWQYYADSKNPQSLVNDTITALAEDAGNYLQAGKSKVLHRVLNEYL